MKPSEYMEFVAGKVREKYGETGVRPLGVRTENTILTPGNPPPLYMHDSVRVREGSMSAKVYWGVVQRGEIPEGVTTIDELAAHQDGIVEMYLTKSCRDQFAIKFDRNGKMVYSAGYKPRGDESLETNVEAALNFRWE